MIHEKLTFLQLYEMLEKYQLDCIAKKKAAKTEKKQAFYDGQANVFDLVQSLIYEKVILEREILDMDPEMGHGPGGGSYSVAKG